MSDLCFCLIFCIIRRIFSRSSRSPCLINERYKLLYKLLSRSLPPCLCPSLSSLSPSPSRKKYQVTTYSLIECGVFVYFLNLIFHTIKFSLQHVQMEPSVEQLLQIKQKESEQEPNESKRMETKTKTNQNKNKTFRITVWLSHYQHFVGRCRYC